MQAYKLQKHHTKFTLKSNIWSLIYCQISDVPRPLKIHQLPMTHSHLFTEGRTSLQNAKMSYKMLTEIRHLKFTLHARFEMCLGLWKYICYQCHNLVCFQKPGQAYKCNTKFTLKSDILSLIYMLAFRLNFPLHLYILWVSLCLWKHGRVLHWSQRPYF